MSETKKKRFVARILDSKTVQKIAPNSWVQWMRTYRSYLGTGYSAGQKPPESGTLLVQSPYADWYNLTWGLAPNQDMPKWRYMFRARPEIRRGTDVKTILAVGKGVSVVVEHDKDVEDYINRLLNHLNIRDFMQAAVSDMLVYGSAFYEKVRTRAVDEQENEQLELAPIESRLKAGIITPPKIKEWNSFDLDIDDPREAKARIESWVRDVGSVDAWMQNPEIRNELEVDGSRKRMRLEASLRRRHRAAVEPNAFEPEDGELVELKPLDPLWMRINRDAFGNVTGFVQWGLSPIPQSIISEKIVFLRWMPKTWAFENAYGTSILMPVQRHVSLLIQAEEDMKVFWHQYAKPMLVGYGGTPDKPYPVPRLQDLMNKLVNRQTNTDVVMPGDSKLEMLQSGTGKGTSQTFSMYAKYLREKIYETLGIPSVLMNLPGEITRATSDVTLQAFIAEEMMIQNLVGEQILKQIIEPEVRRHFADKYPKGDIPIIKMVWPAVLEEDRNKKIDRIIKATGVPFMSINEARAEAGLEPLDGEEYDKIATAPATPLGGPNPFSTPSKNPETNESERTGAREEMQQKSDRTDAVAQLQERLKKARVYERNVVREAAET